MRSLRPRAVAHPFAVPAVLGLLLAVTSTNGVGAAVLPGGVPASRIKLDPPATTLNTGNPVTLAATVVTFKGAPVRGVAVKLTVLHGPNQARTVTGTTAANGQVRLSYTNSGEPGTDVVQATFIDTLELHKSNRPFVTWLTGPPAAAIPSPAAITVTPACFQPASAAAATSDTLIAVAPRAVPTPALPAAPLTPYMITVDGVNFNPFTGVLVTFDTGLGGEPESFQASTDGFGHFNRDIIPRQRPEGLYLVRADDLLQREATATFVVPCFQPSLALDPPIGPPGFVPTAVGTGFPAGAPVTLTWDPGITARLDKPVTTDTDGSFRVSVIVLYHDLLGPRQLRAVVANPNGPNAGSSIEADAPYLVTPGRPQPPDFLLRR